MDQVEPVCHSQYNGKFRAELWHDLTYFNRETIKETIDIIQVKNDSGLDQ